METKAGAQAELLTALSALQVAVACLAHRHGSDEQIDDNLEASARYLTRARLAALHDARLAAPSGPSEKTAMERNARLDRSLQSQVGAEQSEGLPSSAPPAGADAAELCDEIARGFRRDQIRDNQVGNGAQANLEGYAAVAAEMCAKAIRASTPAPAPTAEPVKFSDRPIHGLMSPREHARLLEIEKAVNGYLWALRNVPTMELPGLAPLRVAHGEPHTPEAESRGD